LGGYLSGVERRQTSTPSSSPAASSESPREDRALVAAETLARWLDDRFLDPLLGLYPVLLAAQRRAPKALLARMLLNLAADAAGGAIPILGDIWDFMFKANARNLDLLRARSVADRQVRGHWSDRAVLALAVVAVLAAFALPVLVAVGLWHLFARALGR
jgi:hypothetical protein